VAAAAHRATVQGPVHVARHVMDTHFEASLLE